ncbi:hypothetical protein [Arthrobacter bambusae]|uniref:Uncharacterized protein n=1 Tax=Arthrobacter bambusae TaxID=1338426 RepID=A0AAW8DBI0_9MICC|nr:hypothetical protein [Arthrobacter bambusae]MDP9903237.1 hypothetical protein [Arthrobacter bambusae]MDQ0128769.1 hypothetical protein [Arthrobacter bambusae]MDQ0180110.1 hypothetical protein [Arthrobacter bambusae]
MTGTEPGKRHLPPPGLGSTFTALGAVNNTATLVGVIGGGSMAGIASGTTSLLLADIGSIAAIIHIRLGRTQTRAA